MQGAVNKVGYWVACVAYLFFAWATFCFFNATFWFSLRDPTDKILWREGFQEVMDQISSILQYLGFG